MSGTPSGCNNIPNPRYMPPSFFVFYLLIFLQRNNGSYNGTNEPNATERRGRQGATAEAAGGIPSLFVSFVFVTNCCILPRQLQNPDDERAGPPAGVATSQIPGRVLLFLFSFLLFITLQQPVSTRANGRAGPASASHEHPSTTQTAMMHQLMCIPCLRGCMECFVA